MSMEFNDLEQPELEPELQELCHQLYELTSNQPTPVLEESLKVLAQNNDPHSFFKHAMVSMVLEKRRCQAMVGYF